MGNILNQIGIENYILGIRSAPTRWALRLTGAQTNKEKGISNLKITAEQGRYLAPYARVHQCDAPIRGALAQHFDLLAEVRNNAVTCRRCFVIHNIFFNHACLVTKTKQEVSVAVIAIVLHDMP